MSKTYKLSIDSKNRVNIYVDGQVLKPSYKEHFNEIKRLQSLGYQDEDAAKYNGLGEMIAKEYPRIIKLGVK